MKIFTTINPNGNFDVQLEAMNSWSNKYEVYSVNTKEEIEKISSIYTNVKFIETDITYQYNNKNLPLTKKGEMVITKGTDIGQRTTLNSNFSYYE